MIPIFDDSEAAAAIFAEVLTNGIAGVSGTHFHVDDKIADVSQLALMIGLPVAVYGVFALPFMSLRYVYDKRVFVSEAAVEKVVNRDLKGRSHG